MKKTVLISVLCLILLLVAAAPAGAAAPASAAPCPSSCSCFLPEEAAKAGSPGYCEGVQRICAADTQNNAKYCYAKPAVKAPAVIATLAVITTTTPAPQACAAGCSCLSPEEGKVKNLPYCGGKQVLCSGSAGRDPRYCFAPVAVTVRTTVPAIAAVSPRVSVARLTPLPTGTTVLPPVSARILATTPVPAATTGAVPADRGILSGIGSFFGSFLGTPSASTPSRMISCNGTLADIMADPANCGACGQVCPDGSCVMGTCRDRSGQVSRPCGARDILCNGTCTDIWFSESSCGNCTNACGPGEGCCSGACTNLSERENCGSCGNACRGMISDCIGGGCVCYGNSSRCSDGYCYFLMDDERHCGSCDTACRDGETCCSGTCTNLSGNDPGNCGSCGRQCQLENDICVNGQCVSTGYNETNCGDRGIRCGAGESCCGGECVDLDSPESCGTSCFDRVACGRGQVCCNRACEYEQDNCGTCGTRCDFNERCCNGACTLVTGTDRCGSCSSSCDWNEVCHHVAGSDYDCISLWDSLWD